MAVFRVSFRQEVFIQADSEEEAKEFYERMDLGAIDLEVNHGNLPGAGNAIAIDADFVETCSFEEYDW